MRRKVSELKLMLMVVFISFIPTTFALSLKPCKTGCDTVHLTENCWHPCVTTSGGECENPACILQVKSGDTYLDQCSCGSIEQKQWYEYRKYDCNNDGIADCKCEEKFFTPKRSVACVE